MLKGESVGKQEGGAKMSEGKSVTYVPPEDRASRPPSFISLTDFAPLKPGGKPGQLLRGPRRVVRLCVFALVVPAALITIPLYVRLILYPPARYPMMATDQRVISRHVSSLWCQAQTTHMNGSFTGYLTKAAPAVGEARRTHYMLHHLSLKDDVKEYWGFYLLKGSTITISSCARWDGGQLMIIRGVENLRHCAWIGEADSAEDMAEDDDVTSNERRRMKEILRKNRPKIVSPEPEPEENGHSERENVFDGDFALNLNGFQSSRNGDVAGLNISEIVGSGDNFELPLGSEERKQSIKELLREAIRMSKSKTEILRILHNEGKSRNFLFKDQEPKSTPNKARGSLLPSKSINNDQREGQETMNTTSSLENAGRNLNPETGIVSSRKLKDEPRRGKTRRQNTRRRKKGNNRRKNLTEEEEEENRGRHRRHVKLEDGDGEDGAFEELDTDDVMNVFKESRTGGTRPSAENAVGGQVFFPEGLKFERGMFNQSTTNDNSREEHKSSYSSSEEALASCEGVIMTLPLVPFRSCTFHNNLHINRIVYDIPVTGTYYFVFSSDNEIYVNDLFFNITMERVVYDVTANEKVCANVSDCTMSLNFWSNEEAVVEVPQEAGWDNAYVLDTKCEPRVYIYLTLLLLVPICIICCAFH